MNSNPKKEIASQNALLKKFGRDPLTAAECDIITAEVVAQNEAKERALDAAPIESYTTAQNNVDGHHRDIAEMCANCLHVQAAQVTVTEVNGNVYSGTYFLRGEDRPFRCVSTDHGLTVTRQ